MTGDASGGIILIMFAIFKTFRNAILASVLLAVFSAGSASGEVLQNTQDERIITPPMMDYSGGASASPEIPAGPGRSIISETPLTMTPKPKPLPEPESEPTLPVLPFLSPESEPPVAEEPSILPPSLPIPQRPTTAEKPFVDPGVKPALMEMNVPESREIPSSAANSSETKDAKEVKDTKEVQKSQPWGLLTLLTFLLMVSLAGNVFLFWQFRDQRKILEELLR